MKQSWQIMKQILANYETDPGKVMTRTWQRMKYVTVVLGLRNDKESLSPNLA